MYKKNTGGEISPRDRADTRPEGTGLSVLRTGGFGKTSYKIQFWEFAKIRPGNEEISAQRFYENYRKNLKTFKKIFKK